jgi:hypothetical protein
MGKALAGVAAIFGFIALIVGAVMVENVGGYGFAKAGPMIAFFVFSGLWMMAVAGALYYLLAKT